MSSLSAVGPLAAVPELSVVGATILGMAPITPDSPFVGRSLFIHAKQPGIVTLENVQFRRLGDRAFLVGKEVESAFTKATFAGKQVWVPVNDVELMVELDGQDAPKK